MNEAPFDLANAHRWFAIECNNGAWDLIETTNRTAEQDAEMVQLSYASMYHWRQVGESVPQCRAEVLLATALAKACDSAPALHYARAAEQTSRRLSDLSTFDKATIEGSLKLAHQISGDAEQAQLSHQRMMECIDQLTDDSESALLLALYS